MSQVKRHNPLQLAGDGLDPASANFDVSMYEVLKSWGASEAAVALPLPPMRRIRFEPVLSPLRVEALAAVSQVKLTELQLDPFSGGDWVGWRPGQVQRWSRVSARRWRSSAGRERQLRRSSAPPCIARYGLRPCHSSAAASGAAMAATTDTPSPMRWSSCSR